MTYLAHFRARRRRCRRGRRRCRRRGRRTCHTAPPRSRSNSTFFARASPCYRRTSPMFASRRARWAWTSASTTLCWRITSIDPQLEGHVVGGEVRGDDDTAHGNRLLLLPLNRRHSRQSSPLLPSPQRQRSNSSVLRRRYASGTDHARWV